MTKKIVAIGGGENGRYLDNGKYREYETEPMDKEIIRLTGKENPNYLFMVHAQPFNNTIEEGYFETMKKIYGDMFGCNCMYLKSTELDDMEVVKEKIAWADIIYEGGGDTLEMINLWKKTGFDKVLLDAYNDGKVLCGVSAGAVCWFNSCNSDSVTSDNDVTFSSVDCLNFIDAYITPHTDENGRYESTKEELKNKDKVGIMLSNCSCIEIVDNEYRIITSEVKAHNIKEAYALRGFYQDDKYYEEKLEDIPEEVRDEFEKAISLRVIDNYWMEHISTMSHLRDGIGLRGYANTSPLQAYTMEGYQLFDEMIAKINRDISIYLLKSEIRQNIERKQVAKTAITNDSKDHAKVQKKSTKVGRNDPCPCGSGKKYKQCCGK